MGVHIFGYQVVIDFYAVEFSGICQFREIFSAGRVSCPTPQRVLRIEKNCYLLCFEGRFKISIFSTYIKSFALVPN